MLSTRHSLLSEGHLVVAKQAKKRVSSACAGFGLSAVVGRFVQARGKNHEFWKKQLLPVVTNAARPCGDAWLGFEWHEEDVCKASVYVSVYR